MSIPATHERGCSREGQRRSVYLPSHDYCPSCARMIAREES